MIRTRMQAVAASLKTMTNTPGMCQAVTRGWFNAPSVGDVDGDGRADAEDGWKSEPLGARHANDRNPPAGVPLSFVGGRSGDGHRALSLPHGKVRSTDWDTKAQRYKAGVTGTANSIAAIESSMGVRYIGWSETINGHIIPRDPEPPAPVDPDIKQIKKSAKKQLKEKIGPVQRRRLEKILALARKIGGKRT